MTAAEPVTDRIYRLGTDWVGWYLIVDEAVTVVDCGFPGYHHQLVEAVADLGRPLDAVTAVVLTHYHVDHVGSAERIRAETGATVYVPAGDADGVRTGEVPLPSGLAANAWRPTMVRYLTHAVRNGGRKLRPVTHFRTYGDGELLDVAGGMRAVQTPGHTGGHCSLLAEEVGVLFAGDALATVDFLSGQTGPRLMRFHEDSGEARASLARLAGLEARMVVCGHGRPFEGTPAAAVEAARAAGA